MGKRRQHRIKNVVPVRVWGMDSLGKPFIELSHTLDISHSGVRIGGFSAQVGAGDVIGVQYHHRKARFEVAWVGRPGSSRDKQVGIRCLEGSKDIFALGLSKEAEDDFVVPLDPARNARENREYERYPVSGGVELLSVKTNEGNWAELADVSLGGCYLSSLTPLPVQTNVELIVQMKGFQFSASGTVRTCHPRVGMGIEFTAFKSEDERTEFRSKVERLGMILQTEPEKQSAPVKPDAVAVGNRLKSVTQELYDIEQLIQSTSVNPEILREFREATSRVRTTSWAVQRWMELQEKNESLFPVVTYLNTDRIRLASRLCSSLYHDMQNSELKTQKKHLDELLASVEMLFTHLAGIDFCVLQPEEEAVIDLRDANGRSETASS